MNGLELDTRVAEDLPRHRPRRPSSAASGAKPLMYAIPILLSLATSLWGSVDRQLWLDEYATWWAATLHRHDFLNLISHIDTVQAPYYVVMHYWISFFGASAFSLRAPSMLSMAVGVAFTVAIGRRVYSAPVGILAGMLLAVVPFVDLYAQTARPYGFAVAFASASTLSLLRCLERPSALVRWLLYVLSVAILGGVHLVALMVLASHFALVTWKWKKGGMANRTIMVWALCVFTSILTLLPIIIRGHEQQAQIGGGANNANQAIFLMTYAFRSEVSAAIIVWLAILGLCLVRGNRNSEVLGIAVWAVLPYAIVIPMIPLINLASLRYLLFAIPPWCILAASALWQFAWSGEPAPVRWIARSSAFACLLLMIPGTLQYHGSAIPGYPDYRAAGLYLESRAHNGDGLFLRGSNDYIVHPQMLAYYLRPENINLHGALLWQSPTQAGNYDGAKCSDSVGCISRYRRLWLVIASDGSAPLSLLSLQERQLILSRFSIRSSQSYREVDIMLLVRAA